MLCQTACSTKRVDFGETHRRSMSENCDCSFISKRPTWTNTGFSSSRRCPSCAQSCGLRFLYECNSPWSDKTPTRQMHPPGSRDCGVRIVMPGCLHAPGAKEKERGRCWRGRHENRTLGSFLVESPSARRISDPRFATLFLNLVHKAAPAESPLMLGTAVSRQ